MIQNELSIAGDNMLETFHIQDPYAMRSHCDKETRFNWDGHIAYHQLSTVLMATVAGFAHLY